MKSRTTTNGKTCFDIRRQFHRINDWLIIRHCQEMNNLIKSGVITTSEQWNKKRMEQMQKEEALFNYAYEYANSVSAGSFSLHRI